MTKAAGEETAGGGIGLRWRPAANAVEQLAALMWQMLSWAGGLTGNALLIWFESNILQRYTITYFLGESALDLAHANACGSRELRCQKPLSKSPRQPNNSRMI
jgi:hypothetical protein